MSRGKVYVNHHFAGIVEQTSDGDFFFQYDDNYLSEQKQPVSLTLPLQKLPYESKVLFPFFDGLIPEGWLLNLSIKNWKINPNDRMALLLAACDDCIGNVSIIADEDK